MPCRTNSNAPILVCVESCVKQMQRPHEDHLMKAAAALPQCHQSYCKRKLLVLYHSYFWCWSWMQLSLHLPSVMMVEGQI